MKYHNSLADWPEFLSLDLGPEKVSYVSSERIEDLGSRAGRFSVPFGIIISVWLACAGLSKSVPPCSVLVIVYHNLKVD